MTVPWSPSIERTIAPLSFQIQGVPAALFTPMPFAWPEPKSAAATIDYSLDLSDWLNDAADALDPTKITVTVTPAAASTDLGVVWSVAAGQSVTFLASGGTASTLYLITVEVGTLAGRTGYWTAQLQVDSSTPSTVPATPTAPPVVTSTAAGRLDFRFANLPTDDPGVTGATYLNGGTVMVSGQGVVQNSGVLNQ